MLRIGEIYFLGKSRLIYYVILNNKFIIFIFKLYDVYVFNLNFLVCCLRIFFCICDGFMI